MSGHTPGPWKAEALGDICIQIVNERGEEAATVFKSTFDGYEEREGWKRERRKNHPNAEANARLIAAAPDVTEKAIRVLAWLDAGCDPSDKSVAELRAAIAKATGA